MGSEEWLGKEQAESGFRLCFEEEFMFLRACSFLPNMPTSLIKEIVFP